VSILASLQHAFTTPELAKLNQELDTLLLTDPNNDTLLRKIITERANLVESLLTCLKSSVESSTNSSLDEQARRHFATSELKANDLIIETVEARRSIIKSELANVSKASKAIKKYKQI
jgi:hypothetical protein